jgi:acyl-CoA synthetase (AMP-forming)/AMP-acid ligase II
MTLVDLLRMRAVERPDAVPYIFLEDGEDDERTITAGELDARARAIACSLLATTRPGERALLVFPPGLDYIAAVFGCLYAGVIAVPAYPPDLRRLARTLPRLTAIVRGAEARVVLTTRAIQTLASALPGLEDLSWIATDGASGGDAWVPPPSEPEGIALLQFTSGSTTSPRGVILRHRSLMANLAAIEAAFELADRPPRTISWLPPYHDMGLIGCVLGSLYSGGQCVLMSPLHFLQQPVRWLRAITKYRGDVSGGPNFAYDLCVRRIDPAAHALDLSSWQIAFDGAEVVRRDTLDRFVAKFGAVGFRRAAFLPCYGLAESTLIAAATPRAAEPTVIEVDRAALERGEVATGDRAVVSSGRATLATRIAIVDPETGRELPDRRIGEVWLAGPSVGSGYWGDALETERTFGATLRGHAERFLRTGDLGFTVAGDLFVTGRCKDLIIVNGRNLFPDDIEQVTVAAHPALRAGCTAAFAIDAEHGERLVVVQETGDGDGAAIRQAIRGAIASAFDVVPHDIVLLPPGTIPKTSSGKVQRHACRDDYAARCAASNAIVG